MINCYLVAGARTPFGKLGGGLRDVSAIDLAVAASRGAFERHGVSPHLVDGVIFGNAMQTSPDAIYCARHVGLKAGVPTSVPALTLNRICGSGLEAIATACRHIICAEAAVVLAGGAENMSQAPYSVRGARDGKLLGGATMDDMLSGEHSVFFDPIAGDYMGGTAENLAEQYDIRREQADSFALRSQELALAAISRGRFAQEIQAVTVPSRHQPTVIDVDEYPRRTSLEQLAKLRPFFRKDGQVTAGNSSGINDGAAALVVASEAAVEKHAFTPLARIVAWAVVGVEPRMMGIGPVPAIRRALERAGLGLNDVDLFEVNEAFATQCLAVAKALGLDIERLNVNGGAVALGHPLGASGARITLTLAVELGLRRARYGVASACIGGGQGIAVVLEGVGQ